MINIDLRNGGGAERTLLNFINYIPNYCKELYDITVVQTGILEKERIKKEEIDRVLKQNNVKLITLDQYNTNTFNLRVSLLSTIFNTITERIRNRKYKFYITRITSNANVVYLFHNSFSHFIKEGPIVIGSFHERNLNPKAYGRLPSILIKLIIISIKYRLLFKRIDYFHYQAYNYKDYVPMNSFYLPSGLEIDKFIVNEHEREIDEVTRILFVGRLVKSKGIDVLIEAFRNIKNKGKYELHIVGSGEMEVFIENLEINGLIFHGRLDDDELLRIYKKCDIFVFPSKGDIYGLVVLEAIASGEYVIVNKTLRGVFDNFERLGVLEYANHDYIDLADRILKFKKNYSHNKNVEDLLKKYDWKEIDNRLYMIIQDLVTKTNIQRN